jgi:osmotically inducible protein OsmC
MPVRKASAVWEGGLKGGEGRFEGATGIGGRYSFSSRFEHGTGSNPEELLAAADAACYSMALSLGLEKAGATPISVTTEAACTIDKVGEGFKVTTMKLTTRVKATGIDAAKFQEIAEATKTGCPISAALAGNVNFELDAALV